MVRSQGKAPVEAWRALKTARFRKAGSRNCGPAKQSVYNYVHGHTHRCDKTEKRGRGKHLTNDDVRKLLQTRRRLIKQAASTKRVRYCDIIAAAKLGKSVCERTVADRMRARGCKYRSARNKLYLREKDAKMRVKVLKQWVKKPKAFWVKKVHGWLDNKKWVRPLTPQQRAKYNATKVSGHLRFAKEGQDQGFTRPRVDHALLGIPSINICAMVAKDRVILWHECGSK